MAISLVTTSKPHRQRASAPAAGSRSAWFWDAGLFIACRESNEVVRGILKGLSTYSSEHPYCTCRKMGGELPAHCALERCCGDIFRSVIIRMAKFQSCYSGYQPWRDLVVLHTGSLEKRGFQWLQVLNNTNKYAALYGLRHFAYVGLEFDSAWMDPETTYSRVGANSQTLDLFLEFMKWRYREAPNLFVWLIDRSSSISQHNHDRTYTNPRSDSDEIEEEPSVWGSDIPTPTTNGWDTDEMVYYDMDMEYKSVEIFKDYSPIHESDTSACFFLYWFFEYARRKRLVPGVINAVGILSPRRRVHS